MLYEMLAVARVRNNINEVKEIARSASALILAHGGVVRGITNWGPSLLTKTVKKNQARHTSGHHFLIRFDASPATQDLVKLRVAVDPRMVRCAVVKVGGGGKGTLLRDVCDVPGKVNWKRSKSFGVENTGGEGAGGLIAGLGENILGPSSGGENGVMNGLAGLGLGLGAGR